MCKPKLNFLCVSVENSKWLLFIRKSRFECWYYSFLVKYKPLLEIVSGIKKVFKPPE